MAKRVHEEVARLGHALSNAQRLRSLNLLAQRSWPVSELASELGQSVALTSAQLKVLREVGLIQMERRGREQWSRLASGEIVDFLLMAQRLAGTLSPALREEERREASDPLRFPLVDLHEFSREMQKRRWRVLDLRPRAEYESGHLPGAVSYPYPERDHWDLTPLRKRTNVVAYCRGRWCGMARAGVAFLNDAGVATKRLPAGVVDWTGHNLSLQTGPEPGRHGTQTSTHSLS